MNIRSSEHTVNIFHLMKMKGVSGSENHLLSLLRGMDRREFCFHVGILAELRHIPLLQGYRQTLIEAGVAVSFFPMRKFLDLSLILRLRRYMREHRIELVHTHLIHADLYGTLAAKAARIPTIISSRHNDDRFRRHILLIWLNRLLARWQTKIIVISDWVGRFLQEVEGIPAAKIARIHYGLESKPIEAFADPAYIRQQFQIPDGVPILGTIGRLTAQKGQIYLLQAVSLIKKDIPDVRVVIIGEGELRSDLEQHAKTLDITTQVIFTGSRNHRETIRLLSGMDVFVFPSLWEGFGLVLLEAMALKKAIVASNVSAIPESVQDGKTGILVPPQNSQALAEASLRLLKNPEFAQTMGTSGYVRLQHSFSVSQMVRNTDSLYQTCLNRQGKYDQ